MNYLNKAVITKENNLLPQKKREGNSLFPQGTGILLKAKTLLTTLQTAFQKGSTDLYSLQQFI